MASCNPWWWKVAGAHFVVSNALHTTPELMALRFLVDVSTTCNVLASTRYHNSDTAPCLSREVFWLKVDFTVISLMLCVQFAFWGLHVGYPHCLKALTVVHMGCTALVTSLCAGVFEQTRWTPVTSHHAEACIKTLLAIQFLSFASMGQRVPTLVWLTYFPGMFCYACHLPKHCAHEMLHLFTILGHAMCYACDVYVSAKRNDFKTRAPNALDAIGKRPCASGDHGHADAHRR